MIEVSLICILFIRVLFNDALGISDYRTVAQNGTMLGE
jgi:hypothetical protein